MDFTALEQNLCDNIKEAQLKLGFSPMPISLNYMLPSLGHLLDTDADDATIRAYLDDFAAYAAPRFGEIGFRAIDGGYCFRVPAEGVVWVHEHAKGNEFLASLLETVRRPDVTLEDVFAVFRSASPDAVIEESPDDEFDYLAYFPSGNPDAYRYCISAEEEIDGSLHISYHRFTAADYADFGF